MSIIFTTDKDLPTARDNDFYETPQKFADWAVRLLSLHAVSSYSSPATYIDDEIRILDPGCGTGVWGNSARAIFPNSVIVGIDIVNRFENKLSPYNIFYNLDYIGYDIEDKFDLIVGNPPYGKKTGRDMAERFVMKSRNLLEPNGKIGFLLRSSFLESQGRYARLFNFKYKPELVYVSVDRLSFYRGKKSNTDNSMYIFVVWGKESASETKIEWMNWK